MINHSGNLYSQDTLPKFTLIERGSRVVISWVNPFKNIVQLNIQRSSDSLRNYMTIFSPASPEISHNGFTDATEPGSRKVFYRIFYVLEGGDYFFTKSKRAIPASASTSYSPPDVLTARDKGTLKVSNIDPTDTRVVTIKIKDTVYRQLPGYRFKNFRDSILRQTKDTLFAINDSLITINPYVLKEVWRASNFIFVNRSGYINISLPKAEERKYRIKFFDESGEQLFEIHRVKESPLIFDKSIFVHSGWFFF